MQQPAEFIRMRLIRFRIHLLNALQMNEIVPDSEEPSYASFHLATQNLSALRFMRSAHRIHYQSDVNALVDIGAAPLPGNNRCVLPPHDDLDLSFQNVLENRRSVREWSERPLSASNLSSLLRGSVGFKRAGSYSRYVANSGNLGSVRAHVVAMSVEGITAGIYTYDSARHDLVLRMFGDYRHWIRTHVCFQREFADAAALFILEASIDRLHAKYGPRGYRLALLDIGHVSQNLYLISSALGLGACATAGFFEREVEAALNLDGVKNCALLVVGVGRTRTG
jgi:SagB-type dehydrogenase family enzyme